MSNPRLDLSAFADLAGQPLADWQARSLRLESPITVIIAGRGMGKSRSLALLGAWSAFRLPEQRVLIVSASEAAARRVLAEVRRVADAPALRGSVVDEQAGLLTLTNGSEVRSVPASERQVRGWAADLLLVDEAAFVPDELLLGAAFPTTTARSGRIVLASSASVAVGALYDHARLGEEGSEHVRTHRWVARAAGGECAAPWITPSLVARDRASLGELRFRAEYLAEFATGADSLFSRDVLDRATADYLIPDLAAMRGPARATAGVDWGATSDRSALVAVGRLPIPGERVFGVRCARRWPAGHPLGDVVQEIADAPAHFDCLVAERNGLGAPCAEMLWKRIAERPSGDGGGSRRGVVVVRERDRGLMPRVRRFKPAGFVTTKLGVHVSAEQKAATYSALRLLIDRGRLLLPACAEELRRELLMLRVDLTATGSERIEAGSGHDDLADALALALVPHRPRGGAWRTLIGKLAEPRRPLPEAELPGGFERLRSVETPGGLRVPREPIWQSVRGAELTLPDGLDPDDLIRDPVAEARTRELRGHVADAAREYHERKGAADAV